VVAADDSTTLGRRSSEFNARRRYYSPRWNSSWART